MNEEFKEKINKIPSLFGQLLACDSQLVLEAKLTNMSAIYVFYEGQTPIHVGRTKRLKDRIKDHTTCDHNKASFAFKLARQQTGMAATYKRGQGRGELVKDQKFKAAFEANIERVKAMSLKFLPVKDPLEQYLLELYAAIELRTSLTEFETH